MIEVVWYAQICRDVNSYNWRKLQVVEDNVLLQASCKSLLQNALGQYWVRFNVILSNMLTEKHLTTAEYVFNWFLFNFVTNWNAKYLI